MIDDLIYRIERAIHPDTADDYDAEALRHMLSEMANELTVAEANAKDVERLQPENDHLRAEVQALRELLAVRVAGALLYGDDGELQDNTQHPCIDFRRDSPEQIRRKLHERGLANYRRSLDDTAATGNQT